MLVPILIRELCRDTLKLVLETMLTRNVIASFQHGRYSIVVRPAKLPQIHRARVLSCAGISHIKDVFQLGIISRRVDDGDTLRASAYIPPHALVPEVIFGAGSGIRSLGVYHDLLVIWVLVQPRGGLQERHPALMTAGDLPLSIVRHLTVRLYTAWHRLFLLSKKLADWREPIGYVRGYSVICYLDKL